MLGVLRAVIPGAAFAETGPTLISQWRFDETSGLSFADSGPANVPMDIVGTWADLSTDSMIQGVGGTSAYTNGSGHATIPADVPEHDLAALTISFYYQRNSAAAKHTLLAAGNGTQPGDFSIEVLANGRLRGYHVGQDAQLRFFEGTNGITGTDLQVGTAHRIDLTLGPMGARIYLNGDPLTTGFILANTNTWNNTRVKYLGIFPDGALSPADGAFDGLRLWDQQLNSAQIATLQPAQSITVPGSAGWLGIGPDPSVDYTRTLPTGSSVIYVSTAGNDTTGTGTEANPYRTIAKGITSVSSGANNGVVIRGGTYTEKLLELNKGGTAGNKLKLMAYPGETVNISNLYDISGGWTTHNASLKQYNSVVSISETGPDVAGVFKWTGPDGLDEWWGLGSYKNLTTFNAGTTGYFGPGVRGEGGKIRLRIQHPVQSVTTLPNSTWTWDQDTPTAQDMMIFPHNNSSPVSLYCLRITASHVEINGIRMLGYSTGIRVSGANNINFINCYVLYRSFAFITDGTSGSVHHLLFDKFDIQGCAKSHLYLPFRKYKGSSEFVMDEQAIAFFHATAPYTDVEIKNCTWLGTLQNIRMPGRSTRLHVHHNYVWNRNDDGTQCDGTVEEYELHHNYWHGSQWGPQSSSGSNFPGRVWIHHEIIDNSEGVLTDTGVWGAFGCFNRHVGGATWAGYPVKMWNCTIITNGNNASGEGQEWKPGISYLNDGQNTTGFPHDVFNCIVVVRNTAPGQSGGDWSLQRHDHYDADESNDNTTSRFDGCCLWRAATSPSQPFFEAFKPDKANPTNENYSSLAAWLASASFTASKAHYAPGWHANSFQEDPSFSGAIYRGNVAAYIPQNPKCATNGISLVSLKNGWPGQANIQSREGLDTETHYVGAINPAI